MSDTDRPNNPDLIVQTSLGSLSIQAMLYGIFFALFCASTYLMVERQREVNQASLHPRSLWRKTPFLAGMLLFITITGEWSTYIWRSFEAFVSTAVGSHSYYSDVTVKSYYVQSALGYVSLVILDAIIVYRLWVIWTFKWKAILFPCLSWIISAGLISGVVWALITLQVGVWNVLLTPTFITHAVTNIYCSGMIAWKLWRTSPRLLGSALGRRTVSWYLTMLVEMAALYLAIELLFFIVYLAGSNTKSIFENAIPPIAAIAFMFINVRVGLGHNPRLATFGYSAQTSSSGRPVQSQSQTYEMEVIHITGELRQRTSDTSPEGGVIRQRTSDISLEER